MIRPLYRRPFDTLVATWGLSLLLRKIAEAIFGLGYQSVSIPLPGTVELLGTEYPIYRLLPIAISLGVVGALIVWFECLEERHLAHDVPGLDEVAAPALGGETVGEDAGPQSEGRDPANHDQRAEKPPERGLRHVPFDIRRAWAAAAR